MLNHLVGRGGRKGELDEQKRKNWQIKDKDTLEINY